MNVNLASLKKTHDDKATEVFAQVAELTGAGHPGDNHDGGIDCSGCDEATKQKINSLIQQRGPANPKEGEK